MADEVFGNSLDETEIIPLGIVFCGHPSRFLEMPVAVIKSIICQNQRIFEPAVIDVSIGGFSEIKSLKDVSFLSFSGFAKRLHPQSEMLAHVESPSPCLTIAVIAVKVSKKIQAKQGHRFCVMGAQNQLYDVHGDSPTNKIYIHGIHTFPALKAMNEAALLDWAAKSITDEIRADFGDCSLSASASMDYFTVTSDDDEQVFDIPWLKGRERPEIIGRICANINNVRLPSDISSGCLYAMPVSQQLRH